MKFIAHSSKLHILEDLVYSFSSTWGMKSKIKETSAGMDWLSEQIISGEAGEQFGYVPENQEIFPLLRQIFLSKTATIRKLDYW